MVNFNLDSNSNMLIIDALIRYPTVAFLLLVALLCYRDGKNQAPAKYAALLTISLAAMLLSLSQPELQLSRTPLFILHIIAIPNIIFVWWLGLSMFQEGFKPKIIHWTVFIVWAFIGCIDKLVYFEFIANPLFWAPILSDVLVFIIMIHLAYITLSGRANDLVEPRRRLRLFFVLATVIGTLSIVTVEEIYSSEFANEVALFRSAVIFPLSLWGVLWLTKLHPEKLLFQSKPGEAIAINEIDPRDKLLNLQLTEQMNEQKVYLEQSLTIRSLATLMSTPEHRLRSLSIKVSGIEILAIF